MQYLSIVLNDRKSEGPDRKSRQFRLKRLSYGHSAPLSSKKFGFTLRSDKLHRSTEYSRSSHQFSHLFLFRQIKSCKSERNGIKEEVVDYVLYTCYKTWIRPDSVSPVYARGSPCPEPFLSNLSSLLWTCTLCRSLLHAGETRESNGWNTFHLFVHRSDPSEYVSLPRAPVSHSLDPRECSNWYLPMRQTYRSNWLCFVKNSVIDKTLVGVCRSCPLATCSRQQQSAATLCAGSISTCS